MQHKIFPWLAAGIGLFLALLVYASNAGRSEPRLSPLMLLFVSELGFFVTLIGAWSGLRLWLASSRPWILLLLSGTCGIMSLAFLYLGIVFWSGLVPVEVSSL